MVRSRRIRQADSFQPSLYSYDTSSNTITNSGLEIAGNNATFATAGASDSLLQKHQWGFAPRIGLAWSPKPKLTVRAGFGIYYDRGELFSDFSPSAGFGFNGPLGVTLQEPFVSAGFATKGATLAAHSAPPRWRRRRPMPPRSRPCCLTSHRPRAAAIRRAMPLTFPYGRI